MRVLVVGSIGKRGETRIDFLVGELGARDIEVVKVRTNYGNRDWREHFDEVKIYLKNSQRYFEENSFDVVVADLSAASDGRTHQLMIANQRGIPTFGFAQVVVDTPWRLVDVDRLFTNINDLVAALRSYEKTIAAD